MRWVTREKARVDRIACPWLIQRFLDSGAEFLFVPEAEVMETARREGAIPFDVPGVELGHHGERCSFDAFLEKYRLEDPALRALALIVRGADTEARAIVDVPTLLIGLVALGLVWRFKIPEPVLIAGAAAVGLLLFWTRG
ncbi:MAG: chromate resistance protein [Candidatus Rokubacteria bacterium]|nr:chromate resistance protein [Candidatus Rokubacteria bacterium]